MPERDEAPLDEDRELTAADFAKSRAWRPGDPTNGHGAEVVRAARLRRVALGLRLHAEVLAAEADELEQLAAGAK